LTSISSSSILCTFEKELKEYFRLCGLSRSLSAKTEYVTESYRNVYRVRTLIEKSILSAIDRSSISIEEKISGALKNSFFGSSKKQGTSVRMPLITCLPTKLCADACYAHDVLDAAPNSVIRGVLNGWIANLYEKEGNDIRKTIIKKLATHVKKAIRQSIRELDHLPDNYSRRAAIRFSHVGEIVSYPDFSNILAEMVNELSNGKVDCVVYSRHKNAVKLNPDLWVVNFTIDPDSKKRMSWAPPQARIVFSAFGGVTSSEAEINFLEHHRHSHIAAKGGNGRICPATLPETKDRSCDAVQCNLCFQPVNPH